MSAQTYIVEVSIPVFSPDSSIVTTRSVTLGEATALLETLPQRMDTIDTDEITVVLRRCDGDKNKNQTHLF